jgi:uroporphyrin-III C-methyltransferase/precorrin-2 dehydrogenase/sirohydrochlorin ferrochelatase
VPFEIVPGLTTAVAAPALAGIPVTHRGTSGGFLVINGSSEASYNAIVDAIPPGLITLVAMMAIGSRAQLVQRLRDRGWSGETSSAIVIGLRRRACGPGRGRSTDCPAVSSRRTARTPPERS